MALKYWEIIANRLKKAGCSLGYVSALDSRGDTIWIVDAHRNGKHFIVRADENLTAFLELVFGPSFHKPRPRFALVRPHAHERGMVFGPATNDDNRD
jgi:hypothetical protein